MVELLDLAPAEDVAPWSSMRRDFAWFHENWLGFALSGGADGAGQDASVVPEILSAIQGRRMVAEVLEAALSEEGSGAVARLARKKQDVRKLLEQLQQMQGGGDPFGGVGGGPDGMRMAGAERMPVAAPGGGSEELRALEAEIHAARDALVELKRKAALEPGYGFLNAPVTGMSADRLQGVLGADEALVLAFPHGAADAAPRGHVWVLRRDRDPVVVAPEAGAADLLALTHEMERFSKGLEGRGAGIRRAAPPVRPAVAEAAENVTTQAPGPDADAGADAVEAVRDAGAARVLPDVVAMDEAEMAGFWPWLEAQMAAAFWRPLAASGMLAGATRVVLATAGDLHNLPFAPGREAAGLGGVALCHVGSLAQVALGRGLYVGEEDGADSTAWVASGIAGAA